MPQKKPMKTTDKRRQTKPPEIKQPRQPKKPQVLPGMVSPNETPPPPGLFRDRRKG